MDDVVRIDLEGCKDILDVVDRTIDGEVEYHERLVGVPENVYKDGFIAGMKAVKGIIEKTRSVQELGILTDYEPECVVRLRQWVSDLQSGMYVNCVYCGHRYGPVDEVPASMADVLKEHVEHCPEHPMNRYREALEEIATGMYTRTANANIAREALVGD